MTRSTLDFENAGGVGAGAPVVFEEADNAAQDRVEIRGKVPAIPAGGAAGTVLKKLSGADYDTAWGAGGGGGSATLAGLTDVQLAGLALDDELRYDSVAGKWKNRVMPAGGGGGGGAAGPPPAYYNSGVAINLDEANGNAYDIPGMSVAVNPTVATDYLVSVDVELVRASGHIRVEVEVDGGGALNPAWYGYQVGEGNKERVTGEVIASLAAGAHTIRVRATAALAVSTQTITQRTLSAVPLVAAVSLTGGGGDQAWIAPALGNAWQNYATQFADPTAPVAGYRKDALGFVHLRGWLSGPGTVGSAAFTLPVGYRPENAQMLTAWDFNNATAVRVQIGQDGTVVVQTGNGYAVLDGITFYAGPPTAVGLSQANEDMASILINATSAGDAGNRSDHFVGGALGAAWTRFGAAPTAQVVKNSTLSILGAAALANSDYSRPFTPNGAFVIEARVRFNGGANSRIAFGVTSTAAADPVGNGDGVEMGLDGTPRIVVISTTGGVRTQRSSTANSSSRGVWNYLQVARDAANNFSFAWSPDRAVWVPLPGYTQVIAIAAIYFFVAGQDAASPIALDLVDVVL